MIGAGSFGQVIAATRKTDNVPVRIEKHSDMYCKLSHSFAMHFKYISVLESTLFTHAAPLSSGFE